MANISYLPAQVGGTVTAINNLFGDTDSLDVEIFDDKDGNRTAVFTRKLGVKVNKKDWDSFGKLFKMPLEHGKKAMKIVEAKGAEEDKKVEKAIKAITDLFMSDPTISACRKSTRNFLYNTVYVKRLPFNSLGAVEIEANVAGDMIKQCYGQDLGNLDLLTKAIREKSPLNTFDCFSMFDYLYGQKIQAKYMEAQMIFESYVRFDYTSSERLYIDDIDIIEELKDDNGVVIANRMVHPVATNFGENFWTKLKGIIEDNDGYSKNLD